MKNRIFYTCCFSGHRPSKLPWKYKEKGFRFLLFKIRLKHLIKKVIKQGYTNFISGMAVGADLIFAEMIICLKAKYKHINLECAIPCKNQTEMWTTKDKKRYDFILKHSNKITFVSKKNYFSGCMKNRNIYMIKNSSCLIAVYGGGVGGTMQTIKFAEKNGLKIEVLRP